MPVEKVPDNCRLLLVLLDGPSGAPLLVKLTASSVAKVNAKNEVAALPAKLIDAWLLSLAAAAMGQPVRVVVVGRNAVVRAPLPPQDEARELLQMLLQTWVEGLCSPLPLPPATALAWLPASCSGLCSISYSSTSRITCEVSSPSSTQRRVINSKLLP